MKRKNQLNHNLLLAILILFSLASCTSEKHSASHHLPISKNQHIALIGNNLCSRMLNSGHFETELHLRYPDHELFIRNMCDGGNTLGFRSHSKLMISPR